MVFVSFHSFLSPVLSFKIGIARGTLILKELLWLLMWEVCQRLGLALVKHLVCCMLNHLLMLVLNLAACNFHSRNYPKEALKVVHNLHESRVFKEFHVPLMACGYFVLNVILYLMKFVIYAMQQLRYEEES